MGWTVGGTDEVTGGRDRGATRGAGGHGDR